MKKRNRNEKRKDPGFTLAELMVVIVILGILATFVLKDVISNIFTAKRGVAKIQVVTLRDAIKMYQIKNGGLLPDVLDKLVEKDENGVSYLADADEVPLDPWGYEYFYTPDPNGITFEVGTYGTDGQPGGEGDAADISNKTLANESRRKRER